MNAPFLLNCYMLNEILIDNWKFFFYLKYSGHSFWRANWKELWANSVILWNIRMRNFNAMKVINFLSIIFNQNMHIQDICLAIYRTLSVLYMAKATPPPSVKSNTLKFCSWPPLVGVNLISSLPGPGTTKSVARYYK